MEIVKTEFKPVAGTVVTALSLGTLHTHKNSKEAVIIDSVTNETYKFQVQDLRRIIGSIKVLKSCTVQVQREYSLPNNEAYYIPIEDTGFLWGALEFDWDDLLKIEKAINHNVNPKVENQQTLHKFGLDY